MEEAIKQYGTLGVGGILTVGALWLIRQLITVTIPQMNTAAAAERERESKARQDAHEKALETINDRHETVMEGIKDLRHDVRDFAQIALNKQAVDEAIRRREAGEPRSGG